MIVGVSGQVVAICEGTCCRGLVVVVVEVIVEVATVVVEVVVEVGAVVVEVVVEVAAVVV